MRCAPLLLASVLSSVLAGCGGVGTTSVVPKASAALSLAGSVHGGQQPVAFSTVTLYRAGTGGYGSGAAQLYQTISDAQGSFTLSPGGVRPWTCNSGDELFITATGGNPGFSTGVSNAQLVMVAPLGLCQAISTSTFINISEVSTVAAAYALAPFFSATASSSGVLNPASLSTSSTNIVGLQNAFATVGNLVSLSSGSALQVTPAGNGTPNYAVLNSLADFLAVCVNSTGTDGNCSNTQAASGAASADTFTQALTIARAPYNNVSNILNYASGTAPFQPTASSSRNDLALTIAYTGVPTEPTIAQTDAAGNIWVGGSGGLYQFSPLGAYLRTTATEVNTACFRIAGDGTVYAGTSGGSYAFSSTGALLQTYAANFSANTASTLR